MKWKYSDPFFIYANEAFICLFIWFDMGVELFGGKNIYDLTCNE